ncbi:MAG: hypothetical protein JWM78_2785 [Verrucomicrobiaceae bacterium]|nr:hypothetical protein [Verrucomicrobiaceae bacterium]
MHHFRSLIKFVASLFLLFTAMQVLADDSANSPLGKGDLSPQYAGIQLDGTELAIQPDDGKAYVISFWASWCAPCRAELPVLGNVQRLAGDKMRVIAINIEDRQVYNKLERQIAALGLTPAYDPRGKAKKAFGVGPIPHTIIVGRDGRIINVRKGYGKSALDELAADINQALASAPNNAADAAQ